MENIIDLLEPLRRIHDEIRDAVVKACERSALEELAAVAEEASEDTIYAVDRVSEERLLDGVSRYIASHTPVVLIAEGLAGGQVVLPQGCTEAQARWRIIVDPIDGTRGLMYQKRSGWILTGVAPNKGPKTGLADIELAIQTEIPLVKQHLMDVLWAVKGQGAQAERVNRLDNSRQALPLRPSRADTIAHGFVSVARFFPGAGVELVGIEEAMVRQVLGPVQAGKAHCFEDQYICSGGQLYELIVGHDRLVADLRPLIEPLLAHRGEALGLCCHPYDLCTELIARQVGVEVTDASGGRLQAPLSVDTDVAWIGYANKAVRRQAEPALQEALHNAGLIDL
jgi:fructose-1,6-bisphosphatase/inositol monophosphatase family enzyme